MVIYVVDLDRMTSFYRIFGLDVVERSANEYSILRRTDSAGITGPDLNLIQAPEAVVEQLSISQPPTPRDDTPIKPTLIVASIDAVLSEVEKSGGLCNTEFPRFAFRGYKRHDIYDCEGNRIQLLERVDEPN